MFQAKHVVFRTDAPIDEVEAMLRAQTTPGSPDADDVVASVKDSFVAHARPFRGEVSGGHFRLTRRVRGRQARVQLEGRLTPLPDGGTEVRATLTPPKGALAVLVGGMAAMLAVVTGLAVTLSSPSFALGLLVLQLTVLGLNSRFFAREASKSFQVLRDTVPEHAPHRLAAAAQTAERA